MEPFNTISSTHCKNHNTFEQLYNMHWLYLGILFGDSIACTFALMQCREKQKSGYTLHKVLHMLEWCITGRWLSGLRGNIQAWPCWLLYQRGESGKLQRVHRCVAAAAVAASYQSSPRACLFTLPPVSLSVCHPRPVIELFMVSFWDMIFILYYTVLRGCVNALQ